MTSAFCILPAGRALRAGDRPAARADELSGDKYGDALRDSLGDEDHPDSRLSRKFLKKPMWFPFSLISAARYREKFMLRAGRAARCTHATLNILKGAHPYPDLVPSAWSRVAAFPSGLRCGVVTFACVGRAIVCGLE